MEPFGPQDEAEKGRPTRTPYQGCLSSPDSAVVISNQENIEAV